MERNVVLGVFGFDIPHSAAHETPLHEELALLKIEVVPLKRRDLAHAKTEALGDLDHRAIRLAQCRNDMFELFHSERDGALPPFAAAANTDESNRISPLIEKFPPCGALEHQVHHAPNVRL